MNIFRLVFLQLASSVIGATLLTMPASAIKFSFSFENALNGRASVTGIIQALEEGTRTATNVEVLSNTTGYDLGEYIGTSTDKSWPVSNKPPEDDPPKPSAPKPRSEAVPS
jgi:hypothetical protein